MTENPREAFAGHLHVFVDYFRFTGAVKAGPQCGCSGIQVLSDEEMRERYADVPNFDMECGECMLKYKTEMKTACPEWDRDCRLQE